MNIFLKQHGEMFHETQNLRDQMMNILTDADLGFSPGPGAMTLGELCREMGEVQHMYIQSFKTFRHDWSYRNPEPELERSVAKLSDWYKQLDAELLAALEALTDSDLNKPVDRGGFAPSAGTQAHIYREGLLIFYGKASIYLKLLKKQMTDQWRGWIG